MSLQVVFVVGVDTAVVFFILLHQLLNVQFHIIIAVKIFNIFLSKEFPMCWALFIEILVVD